METLKNKIEAIEKAKSEKRKEMYELYENLIENEENLDMLMIQLGKEVERIFPGLKVMLLARTKSLQSFSNKVENALNKCQDVKSIKEIQIYDVIGLNVVIEKVPDELPLENFKKSKCYDKDFESNITNSVSRRKIIEEDMERCEKISNSVDENTKKIKSIIKEKNEKLETLQEQYEHTKNQQIRELFLDRIKDIKKDIENYNQQIIHCKEISETLQPIRENSKMFYEIHDNECNHEIAKFIIRKLNHFEGIQLLGLKSIAGRFKIIEKDNGYRSIHNCYEFQTKKGSKKIRFISEIQGKSISAYHESNRGNAAKYHIQPEAKPGKKLKNKDLPDILSIKTPEDKQMFLEKIEKTIPRFRLYRTNNGEPEVYKLSLRECYMLYYYNQLFGNQLLGIDKNEEQAKEVTRTELLKDDARRYSNFEYMEL